MPEGDTIWRSARNLGLVLRGRVVEAAGVTDRAGPAAPRIDAQRLEGRAVTSVEARGKHLLMHFDDGRALHSHMGMTGSWRIYRLRDWDGRPRRATIWLRNDKRVVACFEPNTLALLAPGGIERDPVLRRLGPDILADGFDAAVARRRFRVRDDLPLGEAVLHQGIVCGIGNVYKSEGLFLAGMDPFVTVGSVADDALDALTLRTRELMLANLDGGPRRTTETRGRQRHWVYERSGQPCRRCDALVRMRRQGLDGRSTYFCPKCQGTEHA